MRKKYKIHSQLIDNLNNKFNNYSIKVVIPPPVFVNMNGIVLEYDEKAMVMKIQFPLVMEYCNPFENIQGGMVAAAIDNTFGPLSMLVAPPNYTRTLEVKYKKPISIKNRFIIVNAHIKELNKQNMILVAKVLDEKNHIVVTAKATHWIIK